MAARMLDNNDCRAGRRWSFEAEEVSFELARVPVALDLNALSSIWRGTWRPGLGGQSIFEFVERGN